MGAVGGAVGALEVTQYDRSRRRTEGGVCPRALLLCWQP